MFFRLVALNCLCLMLFSCFGNSYIDRLTFATSVTENPVIPQSPKIPLKLASSQHTCIIHDQGMDCFGANNFGQIPAVGAISVNYSPLAVFTTPVVQAVATGNGHTCVIINGGVQCVGLGTLGQLGHGLSSNSATFVSAIPAGSQATDIAAGANTTCAVVNGGIYCWGYNGNRQIGDNTGVDKNVPTLVIAEGSGATKVKIGASHTCAIVAAEVWCWGWNTFGQIGDTTLAVKPSPVKITGAGSLVTDLALGDYHSCAVNDGGLFCWGRNANGQIGNNSTANRDTPTTTFVASSGVTAVTAGTSHTCALVNGDVNCWGSNSDGQMNDAISFRDKLLPSIVFAASENLTQLTAGSENTCAIKNAMKVVCWGGGYIGTGSVGNSINFPVPDDVDSLASDVSSLAQFALLTDDSVYQNCVVQNGGVKCWGVNNSGALGNGTLVSSKTPLIAIPDLTGATDVSVVSGTSNASTCAIVSGGVQCWGAGYATSPMAIIPAASAVTAMKITQYANFSDDYGCAIVAGGVQCWGVNNFGELGNGTTTDSATTPVVAVAAASNATKVDLATGTTCAIVDGGVKCWGYNLQGNLGDGTTMNRTSPVQPIAALSGVTDLSVSARWNNPGGSTVCAVVNGGLKCWGANTYATIGDGTTTNRSSPVDIFPAASGVTHVVGREMGICAIKNSGLYCWGDNSSGALGVGDLNSRNVPTLVIAEGSGVTDVDFGYYQGCAVVSGGLKCWGDNSYGGVGDNTILQRLLPVTIYPAGTGVQEIKMAYSNVTCVRINNAVKCWGSDNNYGLLGNNKASRGSFTVLGFDN